ncbi:DUF305 domain-containing protein [Longispora sp. K20-0274]|uniref:DUF305 domain-containing protein n=1 Tax=Longispora sp. K20-0274 TaxID=3088255 RepID=UPI00399B0FE8
MNTTTTLRRAVLAGATVATALVLAAGCGDGMAGMNHDAAKPTASGTGFTGADVMFAQMMIPHHQQAVTMATLADTRAADPELRRIAAAIRGAQAPEITTMTGWLTGWKQPTAAPGGHTMSGTSGMLSAEELAALTAATGREFDRLFARGMIAHHNGAIAMARDEEAQGANPEARALASAIAKAQATEVEALQRILDRL